MITPRYTGTTPPHLVAWYGAVRPYRLELPAGLTPGVYDLWGGLYYPESGDRLQAISWQTGQRWQDDLVHIGH